MRRALGLLRLRGVQWPATQQPSASLLVLDARYSSDDGRFQQSGRGRGGGGGRSARQQPERNAAAPGAPQRQSPSAAAAAAAAPGSASGPPRPPAGRGRPSGSRLVENLGLQENLAQQQQALRQGMENYRRPLSPRGPRRGSRSSDRGDGARPADRSPPSSDGRPPPRRPAAFPRRDGPPFQQRKQFGGSGRHDGGFSRRPGWQQDAARDGGSGGRQQIREGPPRPRSMMRRPFQQQQGVQRGRDAPGDDSLRSMAGLPRRQRPDSDGAPEQDWSESTAVTRRPRWQEDEDQLSEAELIERRNDYMSWQPDINKSTEEILAADRKEAEEAAELLSQLRNDGAITPEVIEALTEDDWAQLRQLDEALAEMEGAGLVPSDKQIVQATALAEQRSGQPQDADNAMFRWDTDEIMDFHKLLELDYDPEYNFGLGAPRRRTPEEDDPVKVLEAFKPQLMEQLGIQTEAEWEMHAAGALEGFDELRPDLEPRNLREEELSLEEQIQRVPTDHPMYGHVKTSLEAVKMNPHWAAWEKQKFVTGLLKEAQL